MELLRSKKFQVAVAGVIIVILSHYGLDLGEAETTKITGIVMSYILGQGLADFGKAAK